MTDIDAIRQREQAATEGPWIPGGYDVAQTWRQVLAGLATNTGNHAADFAFIAHARQDIPDLLAKVAELTAELAANEGSEDARLTIAERNAARLHEQLAAAQNALRSLGQAYADLKTDNDELAAENARLKPIAEAAKAVYRADADSLAALARAVEALPKAEATR